MRILVLLYAALLLTACVGDSHSRKSELQIVPQLSVQLWSVKDDLAENFVGTLSSLADMGFAGVEFAGDFGPYTDNPKALKLLLNTLSLQTSGAHVSFEQLNADNFQSTVTFYQSLGITTLIIGWEERAWNPDKVGEVVTELNALSAALKPYGMTIGYHNHEHEFAQYKDGASYWDYIARNTAQEVVMQLDVGWAVYAGKDPAAIVKRYPNRTLTTHYKVKPPVGSDVDALLIGQGTVDWLALSRVNIEFGGTRWFVVEQEEYPRGMTQLKSVEQSKIGLQKQLSDL